MKIFICAGMSLDGKISTQSRHETGVSSDGDRSFLYDHRISCDAIIVGGKTLANDDPSLLVKSETRQSARLRSGRSKEPVKIGIISDISGLNYGGDFLSDEAVKKIIFTTERSGKDDIEKLRDFAEVYVNGRDKVDLKRVKQVLIEKKFVDVMIEGGGELIYSFLKEKMVDEINVKIGDMIFGGRTAPTLCDGDGFAKAEAPLLKLEDVELKKSCLWLKYSIIK